jgi:hypothetical protein
MTAPNRIICGGACGILASNVESPPQACDSDARPSRTRRLLNMGIVPPEFHRLRASSRRCTVGRNRNVLYYDRRTGDQMTGPTEEIADGRSGCAFRLVQRPAVVQSTMQKSGENSV